MNRPVLVGIAGASGSGKTYVAGGIVEKLGSDKAVIIQEDSYYRDLSHVRYEDRAGVNFDAPDALEHDLLAEHLTQLMSGRPVLQPIYDYKTHTRMKETRAVEPHSLIILEGILILSNARLRELMDLRVFIETPLDICLIRRLERDMAERGRTLDSVVGQYRRTVRPMYLEHVEPSKRYADIVISGRDEACDSVDILLASVNDMLGDRGQ